MQSHFDWRRERLRGLAAGLLFVFLAGFPAPAPAYEIDTHFYLTYVLSRLAGFSAPAAYVIARADQSLDDNYNTTAFKMGDPRVIHWQHQAKTWHALNGSQKQVTDQLLLLQCAAGVSQSVNRGVTYDCLKPNHEAGTISLVRLGEFLHYDEDTYSHSADKALTPSWVPYGAKVGHFFEGSAPDRVPYAYDVAQKMGQEVYHTLLIEAAHRGLKPLSVSSNVLHDLVDGIDYAYDNALRDYTVSSIGIPPGGPAPRKFSIYYQAANLAKVRCNLSTTLRNHHIQLTPDIATVAYQRMELRNNGVPKSDENASAPIILNSCPTWGVSGRVAVVGGVNKTICGTDIEDRPVTLGSILGPEAFCPKAPDSISTFTISVNETAPCVVSHEFGMDLGTFGTCFGSVEIAPRLDGMDATVAVSASPTSSKDPQTVGQLVRLRTLSNDTMNVFSSVDPPGTMVQIEEDVTVSGAWKVHCTVDNSSAFYVVTDPFLSFNALTGTCMDGEFVQQVTLNGELSSGTVLSHTVDVRVGSAYKVAVSVLLNLGASDVVQQNASSPAPSVNDNSSQTTYVSDTETVSDFGVTLKYTSLTPEVQLVFASPENYGFRYVPLTRLK